MSSHFSNAGGPGGVETDPPTQPQLDQAVSAQGQFLDVPHGRPGMAGPDDTSQQISSDHAAGKGHRLSFEPLPVPRRGSATITSGSPTRIEGESVENVAGGSEGKRAGQSDSASIDKGTGLGRDALSGSFVDAENSQRRALAALSRLVPAIVAGLFSLAMLWVGYQWGGDAARAENRIAAPQLQTEDAQASQTGGELTHDLAARPDDAAAITGTVETGRVVLSGAPLGPITRPDPAEGEPAPAAAVTNIDGQSVSLGGDGKGRLIAFFAHWCPHCQQAMPSANEWLAGHSLPEGVEVVAVSTAVDEAAPNYPPSAWLEDFHGTVVMDDEDMTLANAFGVAALPTWVALDSEGSVLYRSASALDSDELSLLAEAVAPGATVVPDFVRRSSNAAQTASVSVVGGSLTTFSLPDASLGSKAPELSGIDFDGNDVAFGNDGTGRIIAFVAHWCPYCQQELPAVRQYLEDSELADGVEIVAVSTGVDQNRDNYPPSEWFVREQWPGIVLVDDPGGTAGSAFGLTAFPYWVAVDAAGDVTYRATGGLSSAQLDELVQAVAPGSSYEPSFIPDGLHRVGPDEVSDLLADPPEDLVVVDVRTASEFATGHLPGAINIDFYSDDFWQQLDLLDPTQPYLLYCESGNRSGQTFQRLAEAGWPNLYDLDGGLQAWSAAGHELTKQ